MQIVINHFVRRQTAASRFGHFSGTEAQLLDLVSEHFSKHKPSYRKDGGVVLVPVPPEGFFSGTVPLKAGMALVAAYEARQEGEEPRMRVGVAVPDGDYAAAKAPALACDIVLYASKVLAEDGDNDLPPAEGNWEVISINPRMCLEEEPIRPGALIANHLHESGGTATGMTDSEFVEALRKSRAYWNRHIDLG